MLHEQRVLDVRDQAALRYRMELLCDLDDHLMMANSVCGNYSVNGIDLLLFSLMRRFMGFDVSNVGESLSSIAPQLKPLKNLERLLTHLRDTCPCGGLEALNKKEQLLQKQVFEHSAACPEFLPAVNRGDVDHVAEILRK